jgi:hypothetical protein
MLTQQTQIPTHARGKVRALVKAHKDWPAFLAENDLISASAKNAHLIAFALRHAELAAQVEAIIMPTRPAIAPTAAVEAPETTVYVIERLLREFYRQAQRSPKPAQRAEVREKPRIRRQAGRAIA